MTPEVFLSWSGKLIEENTDNVELVRRAFQRTNVGNQAFASWIALHRGSVISQFGPEGNCVLPKSALNELPKIKEQYENALGCQVSFGIGESLSEANKAMAIACIKGAGQTVIWTPNEEKYFNKDKDQKDDILLKTQQDRTKGLTPHAEGTHPGWSHFGNPAKPIEAQGPKGFIEKQEEEGPEIPSVEAMAHEEQGANDLADLFSSYAAPADNEAKAPDLNRLKEETGNIIKLINDLVPDIEEMQSSFPELYQGYLLLTEALSSISQNNTKSLQKSIKEDEAELIEKNIEDFDKCEFSTDEETIKKYSGLETEAPPIFMIDNKVIDGKKRLSAAKVKGKKTIKVYLSKAGFRLGRGLSKLPIGTTFQGRIKEINPDTGRAGYKMVLSGMIASRKTDPNISSIPRAISSTRQAIKMLKINVDISDFHSLLSLSDDIKSELDSIGSTIATEAYAHSVDLASEKLHTRKDQYVQALSISKEDNAFLLILNSSAMWIEEGTKAKTKEDLLKSPKAKQGKNGKYLIIPFQQNKGQASSTLTQTVQSAMAERGIPFNDIEKGSNGEAKTGLLHSFDITSAPIKTGNPGQGSGPIGSVMQGSSGTPLLKGVRVYQQEGKDKQGNKKIERFIATFRTVSENGKASWATPAQEGVKILDDTYDYILAQWDTEYGPKIMHSISMKLGK